MAETRYVLKMTANSIQFLSDKPEWSKEIYMVVAGVGHQIREYSEIHHEFEGIECLVKEEVCFHFFQGENKILEIGSEWIRAQLQIRTPGDVVMDIMFYLLRNVNAIE